MNVVMRDMRDIGWYTIIATAVMAAALAKTGETDAWRGLQILAPVVQEQAAKTVEAVSPTLKALLSPASPTLPKAPSVILDGDLALKPSATTVERPAAVRRFDHAAGTGIATPSMPQNVGALASHVIAMPTSQPPEIRAGSVYVVQQGDTLYGIARKSKLSIAQIQGANGLSGSSIYVGQRLAIPDASYNPPAIVNYQQLAQAQQPQTAQPHQTQAQPQTQEQSTAQQPAATDVATTTNSDNLGDKLLTQAAQKAGASLARIQQGYPATTDDEISVADFLAYEERQDTNAAMLTDIINQATLSGATR